MGITTRIHPHLSANPAFHFGHQPPPTPRPPDPERDKAIARWLETHTITKLPTGRAWV